MKLIDADKLIGDIQSTPSEVALKAPFDAEWFTRLVDRQREIIAMIEKQLTVEAVPVVHGEWLPVPAMTKVGWRDGNGTRVYPQVCSVCKSCYTYGPYNYCPNCGAKMDGGD